jgi:hypothetical protein
MAGIPIDEGVGADRPEVIAPEAPTPTIELDETQPDTIVSVSLKYWHTRSQCISEWQRRELEGLRKFVDKIQGLTWAQIKADTGLKYQTHKGATGHGFSRPQNLSKDVALFELRLSGRARVHGAEVNDVFYLVWLDRNHDVFPE